MRILVIAILVYLAYQFIFNFLVHVFITSQKIRKGFREMSAGMNQTGGDTRTKTSNPSPEKGFAQTPSGNTVSKGDYLDFEEIK